MIGIIDSLIFVNYTIDIRRNLVMERGPGSGKHSEIPICVKKDMNGKDSEPITDSLSFTLPIFL